MYKLYCLWKYEPTEIRGGLVLVAPTVHVVGVNSLAWMWEEYTRDSQ